MPQGQDPTIDAVRRARARAQQGSTTLDAVRAARAAVAPDTVDTTIGPEGIHANDFEARERYMRESDSLSRKAEARRDSTQRANAPSKPAVSQPRVPAAGRGAPGFNPTQAGELFKQIPLALGDLVQGALAPATPAFAPLSSAEARHPTTQAAATRYGPAAVQRVQAVAAAKPYMLPGFTDTPLERAKNVATGLPLMGYNAERAAIEAEGPQKLRAMLGLASMGLLGAGAERAPAAEPVVRGRGAVPMPELSVADEFAAPNAREGIAPNNPLSQLDDAIASGQERITQLDAEQQAAARARRAAIMAQAAKQPLDIIEPSTPAQAAPDRLRTLTDEELAQQELGRTPPPEASAAAPGSRTETAGPAAIQRILAEERRQAQQTFAGPERRLDRSVAGARARGLEDEAASLEERLNDIEASRSEEDTGVESKESTSIHERLNQIDRELAMMEDEYGAPPPPNRPPPTASEPEGARLQALLDQASESMTRREQRRRLGTLNMGTGKESITLEDLQRTKVLGAEQPLSAREGAMPGGPEVRPGRTAAEIEAEAFPAEGTPGPALSDAEHELLYPQRSSPAEQAALARSRGAAPPEPADLTGLDARNAAQRAANARLEAEAEAIPTHRSTAARRAEQRAHVETERTRARKASVGEEVALKAEVRRAEQTLDRYPNSDKRPIAAALRADANERIRIAEKRLQDIADLRLRQPSRRRPKKGLGEEGAVPLGPLQPQPAARPSWDAVDARIGRGQVAGGTSILKDPVKWMRMKWAQFVQSHGETSGVTGALQRQASKALAKQGQTLPMTQRAQLWHKAALDSPKRIAGALYGEGPGYFDDAGNWQQLDSPSLKAVLDPIRGNERTVRDVETLMVAERAPEYEAAGYKTGVPAAEAADVVQTAPPRVSKVAADLHNWMNAPVEGAVRSHALPQWVFDLWKEKFPHYVSYERVFEGEGAVRGGGVSTRGAVRPPARRVKTGSEEKILAPMESIADYGARWIRYTDLHRAVMSTIDLLQEQRGELGDYAVKLDSAPLTPTNAIPQIGELLSDKSLRLEGDRVRVYNAKTNAIETWALDPWVADGLRALNSVEYPFIVELLAAAKSGVQFGVTNNPFFGIANYMRDNLGRPTMSAATRLPFSGTARPLAASFGVPGVEAPSLERFKAMGGGFGQAEQSAGTIEHLRRSLPGRSKLRASQRARTRQAQHLTGTSPVVSKTLAQIPELFKEMSVPFEEATRGAEFDAQKALGLSDLEAYVNATETMGNFAEHGTAAWIRLLNHTMPFFNPRIQGTRAFARAFARNPKSMVAKAVLTLGVPTLALYALNADDNEIEELRKGPGGYNSWFIRDPRYYLAKQGAGPEDWTKYNTIFRVPKPFLPGASATVLEHALDELRGRDPHAFRRTMSDVGNELWQTSMNPVLGVPYALSTNKSLGTGVPIVPEEQTNRVPEEQVGRHPNFSLAAVSRSLPEALRFSPAKAHYSLGQFFGTAGREIPNVADILTQADKLPARRGFADVPGMSRFFARYPTSAAGSVRDVYDETRGPMAALTTLQQLASKGDAAGVQRVIAEHGDELAAGAQGEAYTQALSQLADLAERFEYMQGLSPDERASQRDEMLRLSIELAQLFHGQMHLAPER